MLTIAKLGVGQEDYYLSRVAQGIEDYYSGEGESPGAWIGRGAGRLGLAGEVNAAELRALLAGLDPGSGERLAGRDGQKRVPGWDLTFSAPKSVSVLYGLADDGVSKEVVAAHEAAVDASLKYLDEHATMSRRRIDGEVRQVRGEGLVVAGFRHRTSRAGDPQLHTHALVANVVEHVDGGTGAVHSPVIYRHARTAGFLYQAVLRGELTDRLGVRWAEITNGYADIDGMPAELLETFAKRRSEIEGAMAERGEDSARAAQVAAHRTRAAKEYGVDGLGLRQRWAAEATAAGVDPDQLAALLGQAAPHVDDELLGEIVGELLSAEGLTSHQASFDHRDVVRAWCERLPAGVKVSFDALEDLADVVEGDRDTVTLRDGHAELASGELVARPDGAVTSAAVGERRWSTKEMLEVERHLLDIASADTRVEAGTVDAATVDRALAARDELADEQAAMVRELTTSGRGVDVVVGRAGSGKTYALAAAAQLWRAAGYRPVGLGLAARAAHELETSAGIPSTTVARFLIDAGSAEGHGEYLDERSVVVIDESGMVDTRRLARVVDLAGRAGAKVVLVGDHHQLPAVEAGGAFGALVERRGRDDVIELTVNRRQRELWERDMLDRLRQGAGGRAGVAELVDTYRENGRIHVGATPAEVRAAMVLDWYAGRRDGGTVAMLALRRTDIDELNARARALLVDEGVVDEDGVDVGERTFGVGDRIVCLENDRRVGVHNALFGTVVDADGDAGTVVIEPEGDWGGSGVELPAGYVAEHLDHAYATTIHKAQGATCDRALFLGDDRLYRQAAYTALSRGRVRNEIYLVVDDDRERDLELEDHGGRDCSGEEPLDRFVRTLDRDGAKYMATDERDGRVVVVDEPLSALWARRDDLVDDLGDGGGGAAARRLEDELDVARARETKAGVTRAAIEEQVEATGGWRRRERLDAERRLGAAAGAEARRRSEREQVEALLARARADEAEWVSGHHRELKEISYLDDAIRRRTELAGRAAEIDRPEHIVATLGEPPGDLGGRERWRAAAGAFESYRARWNTEPTDQVVSMSLEQISHQVAARALIDEVAPAAARTGVQPPAGQAVGIDTVDT